MPKFVIKFEYIKDIVIFMYTIFALIDLLLKWL